MSRGRGRDDAEVGRTLMLIRITITYTLVGFARQAVLSSMCCKKATNVCLKMRVNQHLHL